MPHFQILWVIKYNVWFLSYFSEGQSTSNRAAKYGGSTAKATVQDTDDESSRDGTPHSVPEDHGSILMTDTEDDAERASAEETVDSEDAEDTWSAFDGVEPSGIDPDVPNGEYESEASDVEVIEESDEEAEDYFA